jgi:hypothetical protein
MAKDRGLDDQLENDEELLNFELDDLSLSDESIDDPDMDEEIIELVDLVERGSSEDITRDVKAEEWAGAGREATGDARQATKGLQISEDGEPDLDLSDLSLEADMEAGVDEKGAVPEEGMLDVDLKGLLDEDDGITLDFSAEEDLEVSEISEDEISDADLQALLSEAGEELNEEGVDLEPLDISDEEEQDLELESSRETEFLHLKSALEGKIVEEEPAAILDREVEELGAEAELAGEEETAAAADVSESEDTAESEFLPAFGEEPDEEEMEPYKEDVLAGLSEERVEEIISRVVREVVERVARETMTEVAERMIGEAIETLKRSLNVSEG